MAKETNAWNYLDYDFVISLSRLYSLQNLYQSKLDQVGNNLYVASNISDLSGFTLASLTLLQDMVIQEKKLIKHYKNILQKLEEYQN